MWNASVATTPPFSLNVSILSFIWIYVWLFLLPPWIRCMNEDKFFLQGRPLLCSVNKNMKHEQNVRCCRDQDLCNSVVPELYPYPSDPDKPQRNGMLSLILGLVHVGRSAKQYKGNPRCRRSPYHLIGLEMWIYPLKKIFFSHFQTHFSFWSVFSEFKCWRLKKMFRPVCHPNLIRLSPDLAWLEKNI